ncbi:jg14308 [Pararge aegeria aegeria]|uniref:Jg14308 protein n=1 Tax=Pararge aegeria aegeria TaxID=348720 RepID=A0A8S4R6S7_9NEOP|nr:jg14308 [Pararge aegeria aegeria]
MVMSQILKLSQNRENYAQTEKKELHGLQGWFSACGCRGGSLATARGSIAALLRSRAFALVSPRAISAYRARPTSESGRVGAQYERAAARPGTPLRLAGVFADGSKAKAPKYAQLIDPQGNELFVPINTKGEMYEVCPEELSPTEWEETPSTAPVPPEIAQRAHRLPHLLSLWRLPTRVRLLAGTVPIEMAHDVGDDLLLRAAITEPVLVMCTLPEYNSLPSSPSKQVDPRYHAKETLQLLPLNSNIKVRRTQLGFENEKRMFLSARLQKALTFCQLNVDNWIRQISYANSTVVSKAKTAEDLIKEDHEPVKFEKEKKFTLQGLKLDPTRLFGKSDKVLKEIPDETEGSIIFLSKNELEHMNYDVYSDDEGKDDKSEEKAESEHFASEKMHVFREDTEKKKGNWFKNLKLLKSTEKLNDKITAIENGEKYRDIKDPFDPLAEKHSSIERYQDMAKLIEDRFGAFRKNDGTAEKSHSYKSLTTSSSEMGTSQCSSSHKKPVLTKSVSVQTGMPDGSFTEEEDSGINMKHGRKNLSVDQINYCGSMESDSSSGRKLKSLDENMLKKSSATKSSTNLERRQRIQPDLIPEKAMVKSESYNQIQSCEEINMFGAGSLYNDNDFEINYKQHSFITEKLCSEFHVKTKRVLSKSTSNLLHPKKASDKKETNNSNSMPTKTSNESDKLVNFRKKIDKPRAPTPKSDVEDSVPVDISEEEPQIQKKLRRSISSIQKRKLPVIEDLPYGQVADAVHLEEEKIDTDSSSDNIYAEICTPNGNKTSEEDNYDYNVDVLATDPVICNVKKEIINRNDERARQLSVNQNLDNPFRHIEVVVIEKTTDFELDNSSVASSEFDETGSKNDVSIAIDSWERDKSKTSEPKLHAIRLEITSNMDDYPVENQTLETTEVHLSKDNSLSFSNSIHLNGTYPNEAIYDTLK